MPAFMHERIDLIASPADNHLAAASHVKAEQLLFAATGMIADDHHRMRFKQLAHCFERLGGRSSLWSCQQHSGQQNSKAMSVQRFSVLESLSRLGVSSLLIPMKKVQLLAYFLHS